MANQTYQSDKAQDKCIAGDLLFSPERSGKFDIDSSPWLPTYPGLSPSYDGYGDGDSINQPYITTYMNKNVTIPGSNSGFLSTIAIDFGRYSEDNGADLFRNNHSAKIILTIRKNSNPPNRRGRQFMFNIVINRLDDSNWGVDRQILINETVYASNPTVNFDMQFLDTYNDSDQIYTLGVRRDANSSSEGAMNIYGIAYVNT